ncbi:MAG: ABC transporter substrate-binding protein [Chloroflexi bacterium]|nr:ABC transporter substrate-binding protein [Chloroflexota bacterium]
MKRLLVPIIALTATLVYGGCLQPAPPPTAEPKAPAQVAVPVKAAWERDWESTLAQAKKEGTATIYSIWPPSVRTAVTQAFAQKYGINLEFSPFGRSAELVAKVQTESRAGIYATDMFTVGSSTAMTSMKPAGLLGNIGKLLVLPEVTDPKNWTGQKMPFLDKDQTAVGMIVALEGYILFNTDLVKKSEITGYKDLLKPQFKGKITIDDPSISGPGNTLFSFLAHDLWNLEEAKDFLRQLIRQQEAALQRDERIRAESVARGKFAIGVPPMPATLPDLLTAGAPLDIVQGKHITTGAGNLEVPTQSPHPNAIKVFINWLLTKEGQTVYAMAYGSPSLRTDVPTEGMNPIFLLQAGEKYYPETEEIIFFRQKAQAIAREVIAEASKQ